MIFNVQDMDVLRLLRWCRILSKEDILPLFPREVIFNLAAMKLIRVREPEGLLYLGSRGHAVLESAFPQLPPAIPPAYKAAETVRRLRVSRFFLTAYRAGLAVYQTERESLARHGTIFLPSIMRGRGANPWGSSRIAAIVRLGGSLAAAHYVCPGIGRLALSDELTLFANHTAEFRGTGRSLLFAGASYDSILSALKGSEEDRGSRLLTYGEAYRQVHLPVFLLSCDEVGALQLRIMAVPEYRKRLVKLALKGSYVPPPAGHTYWDAIYSGCPVVLAADMELRRIDAAVEAAERCACDGIYLIALDQQLDTVLLPRYRGRPCVRFFALKEETAAALLGQPIGLYVPPTTQFLTEKGEVIHAPLIKSS